MVRIGLAGIGFMGMIHYLAAQKLTGAKVTAVCSRDAKKLAGDWTGIKGNFGPPGTHMDLSGVAKYSDYAAMLSDPDIDLIDICTVTDQHAPMAIAALEAGKHVIVEKAIALSVAEANTMIAAAKKAGKLLMVAHVLPFFSEFAYVAKTVAEGSYGKLLGGHFKRVISKPDWSAGIADAAATGGPAVDLHIHDTHFIGLLAGVPKQVFSAGVVDQGAVNYLTTSYLYGHGEPSLTCSSGALAASGRPFVHGFDVYLEKATLSHDSSGVPLTVYTNDGQSHQPKLPGGDAVDSFTLELQAAVDGVTNGVAPRLLSAELARDALALCFSEIESVKSGTAVMVS
jgi:predicted dehydrogenase